jgi:hypothetical protein
MIKTGARCPCRGSEGRGAGNLRTLFVVYYNHQDYTSSEKFRKAGNLLGKKLWQGEGL